MQCKVLINEAPHRAEKLTFKEAEATVRFLDSGVDEAHRYRQWFADTGSAWGARIFEGHVYAKKSVRFREVLVEPGDSSW